MWKNMPMPAMSRWAWRWRRMPSQCASATTAVACSLTLQAVPATTACVACASAWKVWGVRSLCTATANVGRWWKHACPSSPPAVSREGNIDMEPIRILLVEDQTLMRQGLKTILDLEPGLHVVGEASDGEAGVQAALELRPDVILMDVQLPKLSGVEATAAICAAWPQARVIILTTFDRDDY